MEENGSSAEQSAEIFDTYKKNWIFPLRSEKVSFSLKGSVK